ncbi:hypothetical protein SLA2020_203720 [Shorea laevis]
MKSAQGRSGGILCIWKSDVFTMKKTLDGTGYCGVFGFWGKEEVPCYFINVYSPCEKQEKRKLWAELLELIQEHGGGNWCIGGDFNAIRFKEERQGRWYDSGEMREFNKFIQDRELIEIPLIGKRFTWVKVDGSAMSKLDRFLMSEEFLLNFPNVSQRALKRDLSDHCPILLKNTEADWGPKPFRSLDCWLQHENFEDFVKDKWSSFEVEGRGGVKLKEKLKKLKQELKIWNREVFGHIEKNIEEAKEEINRLDEKGEVEQLADVQVAKRNDCMHKLWIWNERRDSLLYQKARQKWLKEGDANSKFFHGSIVKRRKQNKLEGVLKDGEWMEGVPQVKAHIRDCFQSKFDDEEWKRPRIDHIRFKQLTIEENTQLLAEFTEEEIKAAVWDCDSNKSPGPDGFNFNFIKQMWPVLKEDICEFMAEFHATGKMARGSNASFIVLIPKKGQPMNLGDYRPISLIGCMYKILSKALANRMRKVMNMIISCNQTAFIRGRQIADGIVITNEVIQEAKKT